MPASGHTLGIAPGLSGHDCKRHLLYKAGKVLNRVGLGVSWLRRHGGYLSVFLGWARYLLEVRESHLARGVF